MNDNMIQRYSSEAEYEQMVTKYIFSLGTSQREGIYGS